MILTKRRTSPKQLTNGIHTVIIESISESINNGQNVLIFKFKCKEGVHLLTLPIKEYLLSLIGEIGYLSGIEQGEQIVLSQLINRLVDIEIIGGSVKHIYKTDKTGKLI